MENNELNILDEINKGATIGIDAIKFVNQKVGDPDFKKLSIKFKGRSIITSLIHIFKSIV